MVVCLQHALISLAKIGTASTNVSFERALWTQFWPNLIRGINVKSEMYLNIKCTLYHQSITIIVLLKKTCKLTILLLREPDPYL